VRGGQLVGNSVGVYRPALTHGLTHGLLGTVFTEVEVEEEEEWWQWVDWDEVVRQAGGSSSSARGGGGGVDALRGRGGSGVTGGDVCTYDLILVV